MGEFHPACPKCGKPMDAGHVPDRVGNSVAVQPAWARGQAVHQRFLGGINYESATTIPVEAYRCPACGYLEFYARLPNER